MFCQRKWTQEIEGRKGGRKGGEKRAKIRHMRASAPCEKCDLHVLQTSTNTNKNKN